MCMRVRLGKAVGMQELVKGGALQVLELECGKKRPGKLAMHVGVQALAGRVAGLVLDPTGVAGATWLHGEKKSAARCRS